MAIYENPGFRFLNPGFRNLRGIHAITVLLLCAQAAHKVILLIFFKCIIMSKAKPTANDIGKSVTLLDAGPEPWFLAQAG